MSEFAIRMQISVEISISRPDIQAARNREEEPVASRVLEEEKATFTPLAFITEGGMAVECYCYQSRLAELIATKKDEVCQDFGFAFLPLEFLFQWSLCS